MAVYTALNLVKLTIVQVNYIHYEGYKMKILSIHSTAALILCLLFSNGVTAQSLSQAQAQSLIQPFYALLSGKDTAAQVRNVYAADWGVLQ